MSLTNDQLQAVAHLARIAIEPEWTEALRTDLNAILDQASLLDDPRLNDLEPMAHPLDQTQRLRADEVTETDQRETLRGGARAPEHGQLLMPMVIEEGYRVAPGALPPPSTRPHIFKAGERIPCPRVIHHKAATPR